METVQIHELPRQHVAGTRLAWEVARTLRTRSGWVLRSTAASRRWRLRIGGLRWSTNIFTSFFFEGIGQRGQGVVFAIYFESKHARAEDLETTDFFRNLRARLGTRYTLRKLSAGFMSLSWVLRNNTNPGASLKELARLAGIIGGKRERQVLPAKRARALDARLWIIADALHRDERWAVGTPSMWFEPAVPNPIRLTGFLQPIPRATTKRAIIHTLIMVSAPHGHRRMQRMFSAMKRRALARGYEDEEPRQELVLQKMQPLSVRRALSEADFLESELRGLTPDS